MSYSEQKALIEIPVETGKGHPSKFDLGPINTMITSNYVNGTRFRLSGTTPANSILTGCSADMEPTAQRIKMVLFRRSCLTLQ